MLDLGYALYKNSQNKSLEEDYGEEQINNEEMTIKELDFDNSETKEEHEAEIEKIEEPKNQTEKEVLDHELEKIKEEIIIYKIELENQKKSLDIFKENKKKEIEKLKEEHIKKLNEIKKENEEIEIEILTKEQEIKKEFELKKITLKNKIEIYKLNINSEEKKFNEKINKLKEKQIEELAKLKSEVEQLKITKKIYTGQGFNFSDKEEAYYILNSKKNKPIKILNKIEYILVSKAIIGGINELINLNNARIEAEIRRIYLENKNHKSNIYENPFEYESDVND